MKRWLTTLAGSMMLLVALSSWAATEISVLYAYEILFKDTHRIIADEFMKQNPDIKVTFRAPAKRYEDGTERVLKESITGTQPDVSFQGNNRVRIFADRGLAVPLDQFIKGDSEFAKGGLDPAMLNIGKVRGKVYGLPFSVSTPILYINPDRVKQAGFDPYDQNNYKTWDDVIKVAAACNNLDVKPKVHGILYSWDITGNWLNQALVFSQGGRFMDPAERKVLMTSDENQWAMNMLVRFVKETGMPNMQWRDAQAQMGAGSACIWVWSTSNLVALEKLIGGKYKLHTARFPLNEKFGGSNGKLPAGGNCAIIHSTDAEKQQAAWKYLKFVTSPFASVTVVNTTGYMPVNSIAVNRDLRDFYAKRPNHNTSIKQLPVLTNWYAWPGENALKITDVIKDFDEAIVSGDRVDEVDAVVNDMQAEVTALLPK